MTDAVVTSGVVSLLGRLQGLEIPVEHLEPLAAALSNVLATVDAVDAAFDLSESEPPLVFDPRWT